MKTPEELNTLKNEVENLNKKLAALSEDELNQVNGGFALVPMICDSCSYGGLWSDYFEGMFECPHCKSKTYHAKNWTPVGETWWPVE